MVHRFLRRKVGERYDAGDYRKTEIHNLCMPVLGDHDVSALYIPVVDKCGEKNFKATIRSSLRLISDSGSLIQILSSVALEILLHG